jgi:signal transduction histidine kinase
LAIAREIVARHGGDLRIEEGPGCRVVFELPGEGR